MDQILVGIKNQFPLSHVKILVPSYVRMSLEYWKNH